MAKVKNASRKLDKPAYGRLRKKACFLINYTATIPVRLTGWPNFVSHMGNLGLGYLDSTFNL